MPARRNHGPCGVPSAATIAVRDTTARPGHDERHGATCRSHGEAEHPLVVPVRKSVSAYLGNFVSENDLLLGNWRES